MASVASIKNNLKLLGKQTSQFPTISKLQKNPDVLVHDSTVERLNGRFYQDRVQPVNVPSNVFTSSQFMVNIDFDLVGIQSDVIQNIDVEFNVSNGTTSTVYPLPAPQWITSYTLSQGSNVWENNVLSEVLTIETLIESSDT